MLELPSKEPRARIEYAFELCLSRKPTRAELDRLQKLYLDQVKLACASPESSAKLSSPGKPAEVAALVSLSQVLLNLDEFLTRE